ncbi:unnamed protein product [Polarella glacialis]|uniref:Oxidoreductase-like domain-containing protein n=1 Tax=Polarella glacialis TaxID=89957 RepID=A0A813L4U4_POLGL|nr:unnamed protein product [Polarella glacialis]
MRAGGQLLLHPRISWPVWFRPDQLRRCVASARPVLSADLSEEPTHCCGNHCDPCVWEVYHGKLKLYQRKLIAWENDAVDMKPFAGEPPARDGSTEFAPGDRAHLKNVVARSLLHMNGLLVDVLEEDKAGSRWRVRPVGGHRVLTVPAHKLQRKLNGIS